MRIKNAAWKIAPDGTGHKYPSDVPMRMRLMRMVGRQTWIPRGQHWLLTHIWDPDSEKNFVFEVDFFGKRYQGDMAHYVDWKVFAYGCSTYCELELLRDLAAEIRQQRSKVVFFDVGANVGHHTLFMTAHADQVIAFEPFGDIRRLIEQKLAMNAVSNVRLFPFALGEKNEVQNYYPGGAVNSGTGTFMPEEIGTYQQPIRMQVRRGDEICDDYRLPRIDLMKVDVEGFEPLVFRGLAGRFERDRPVVMTELTDRARSGFGSEEGLRKLFWDDAVYAEVYGREGCGYTLRPFHYATAGECLIVPPEWAEFVHSRMHESRTHKNLRRTAA
jgi:FkbM family methyltransferase